MPVTEWRQNGGVVKGSDGKLYSAVGLEVIGEEPLIGIKRTPLTQLNPNSGKQERIGFVTREDAKPMSINLSREELQDVAEGAKNAYFNNPSEKLKYLQENNPEALELGRQEGRTLSEIGEPYDYQGFITQQVDKYLMDVKGIDLPILKPDIDVRTGQKRLNKQGSTFTMNLLKTEKNTPVFGEEFLIDPNTGSKVPLRDERGKMMTNRGGYVIYQTTGKKVPVPGKYDITGGGGIDPMTIADDYDEGSVSYYTPRIDTASQQKVMQEGKRLDIPAASMIGATSNPVGVLASPLVAGTPTGNLMSVLRSEMSTPQAGVGMRKVPVRDPRTGQRVGTERVSTMNIGSFARTQNPYTGPAAPAMGPSSRVLSGNYQYTPEQLEVNLPTAQSTANTQTVEYYEPQASNLDAVMKQLQAQAGRRRGSRKN